jgi:predicted lipoprotein with Yx(FWY)xxD motif
MRLSKVILSSSLLVTTMITMTACAVHGTPQAAETRPAERVVTLPIPAAAPPPTVAKTQRLVQVLSGPSDQPMTQDEHDIQLRATTSEQIGTFLTDGDGMTLYMFTKDSNRKPTCLGDCATTWRPLLIASPGKIYPNNVDPQAIGYVERPEGTCQVTINGQPVYYFSGDKAPADINGQGVKGTWFAVTPTGTATPPLPGK